MNRADQYFIRECVIRKLTGFTLMEVAVVMAILAILIVAGQGFYTFYQDQRLNAAAARFYEALSFARNTARLREVPMTVCIRNSSGTDCDPVATNWGNGWLIFTDSGAKGAVSTGDEILWVQNALNTSLLLNSSSFGDAYSIQFDAEGKIAIAGSLSVCDTRTGEIGTNLTVSSEGELYSEDLNCS